MTNTWTRGDWMQTYTGRKFYPMAPHPNDVDPIDIAHALSLQCRYNGMVDRFYSVAEHCVLLSYAVPEEFALEALLHDATEAYVGDMVRPLKIHQPEYVAAEDRVAVRIAQRFGMQHLVTRDEIGAFVFRQSPEVKSADTRILLDEKASLMSNTSYRWDVDDLEPLGVTVLGWEPQHAEVMYLARLEELGVEVPE